MQIAKDKTRQIIAENKIDSVADVYELIREGFKDKIECKNEDG